jgi:hypothetical protein
VVKLEVTDVPYGPLPHRSMQVSRQIAAIIHDRSHGGPVPGGEISVAIPPRIKILPFPMRKIAWNFFARRLTRELSKLYGKKFHCEVHRSILVLTLEITSSSDQERPG